MKTLNIENVVAVPSLNKTAILFHELDEAGKDAVEGNWIVDGVFFKEGNILKEEVLALAVARVDASMVTVKLADTITGCEVA